MSKPYPFLVGGKKTTSKETLEVKNPFNDEVIGVVCRPSAEDVEQAIQSAVRTFEKIRNMPSYRRSEVLKNAASLVDEKKEMLAKILCQEAGKPIRHARSEVTRAVSTLTIAAEEAKRMSGEALPMDITAAAGNRLGIVRRFPIGPIAGISPFNFPVNLVCHKVAPALAVGNCITVKPASTTPISALLLGELFLEAGAVPGTFDVIPCSGQLAELLVTDPRFKKISFTGSAEIGWGIKNKAGKKRVCLELGGNAAVIVEPDADMDYAVARCILGGYAYAGQICISVQRVYIQDAAYDDFSAAFIRGIQQLKLGDPLLEETDVGPMIDEASAVQTVKWIEEAVTRGARILTGGNRDKTLLEPAVLENVPADARISCEEVFAPVVVLDKYKTFEEAINKANDSVFGLQAGVFTRDIEKAFRAFHELDVGGVIVNDVPTYRVDHMPYGGVKDSGTGREGPRYAIEDYTEPRLLVINPGEPE
jgi:acyl-CoA reductase-like NAD-dependent aldehyde dehydrogenase